MCENNAYVGQIFAVDTTGGGCLSLTHWFRVNWIVKLGLKTDRHSYSKCRA